MGPGLVVADDPLLNIALRAARLWRIAITLASVATEIGSRTAKAVLYGDVSKFESSLIPIANSLTLIGLSATHST
jgi:hypothetical protein